MVKQYDRDYFDRWYRREGFGARAVLERKVQYAVASAEHLLQRPIRSVLDVGCGEGAWQVALKRLRPRARYLGVDPSAYVVERYGARRNLRIGGLGDLASLALTGPFDLVVCVDVIPYAPASAVRAGLYEISRQLGGVAFVELFTAVDEFEGDLDGYVRRPPATYRRWFAAAGLVRLGPSLFAGQSILGELSALERGW